MSARWCCVFVLKQKTAYEMRISDWSSDVCSSDLLHLVRPHSKKLPLMPQAYPPIEPYKTHRLRVSELHEIHVEESGNPQGIPAVFVHGGPGGGTEAWYRQFFNPQKYRIVLFDQREIGRAHV